MHAGSIWNICVCLSLIMVVHSITMEDSARCRMDISPDVCLTLDEGAQCLSTNISFNHVSLVYTGYRNISRVLSILNQWKGLRFVPGCWAVVQPFLCSVYLPKCDNATGLVERPNREACLRIHDACKVVSTTMEWPAILNCNAAHFATKCKTDYDTHPFNRTGTCPRPLIPTDIKANWYADVPGCGVPWYNPLYTESEHRWLHVIVGTLTAISLASSLFTILTFAIDWHNSKRYPAVVLFYVNVCFFLSTLGWAAQFIGDARRDIIGRRDDTARTNEPNLGSGESASCTIVFVVIYYFTMAACMWFVMLTYARHVSFKSLGTPRDDLRGKVAYMHIVSWCGPLILTVIALIAAKIDGDSAPGVCFISDRDVASRICLLIMPVLIMFIASFNYLIKSLHTLIEIRKDTPVNLISDRALAKIREASLRMGVFSCLSIAFVVTSLCIHIYTFTCQPEWDASFKQHIVCRAMVISGNSNATLESCDMTTRPSAAATAVHVVIYFLVAIAMSSWSWTRSSLQSWERFLRRLLHKPSDKPVRLKKHRMIARAFEKKKQRGNKGKKGSKGSRISISFCSTHDDPLGMRIELQSGSSHEISSFAAAMPMLLHRRGGLVAPVAGSQRRHSDSGQYDVGSMASRLSRRQSVDSQLNAVGIVHATESGRKSSEKKIRRSNRRVQPSILALPKNIIVGRLSRRGSDASTLSNTSARGISVRTSNDVESRPISRASVKTASLNDLPGSAAVPDVVASNVTDFSIFTASGLKPRAIEFRRMGTDAPCITFELPCRNPTDAGELFIRRERPSPNDEPDASTRSDCREELSDVTVTDLTDGMDASRA